MFTDFLSDIFSNNREKDAIIWQGRTYSYRFLLKTFREWMKQLAESSVSANDVVLLEADFSPNAVALLLALIEHSCIVVPLTASVKAKKEEFCEIAQVENIITIDQEDAVSF
ncbi:MAG TPA: long-chain fatty acid--CoA ligase, partial [Desulfobacterales bacterium]|nr:long-chain fatty acid--CoA ligase [Desulfobacterales bacterium]